MSIAIAHSRCIHGSDALSISVETHISNGLPSFTIVGLPETAVRESRDRVRSAILNSGFEFPQRRITVNLAPGDIPKEGTRFDLAIGVGILAASGQLPTLPLTGAEFVAELALDGRLRPVRASLAAALACAAAGRELIVGHEDAAIACLIEDACVRAADNLGAVSQHLMGAALLPRVSAPPPSSNAALLPDLADVIGQPRARRALEVAASGGHNLLLLGPPGTGKSMLAARLPGILPPLNDLEAMSSAAVHSIAGLAPDPKRWRHRPFRAPHHSCSAAALIGGGRVPRPGEISLAHNGVLFLDELPEFDRRALEALREPLELGQVTVARAAAVVIYPAELQLVAAMNPCPCGYDGDPRIECRCTPERIHRYRGRVSGPLAERIDIHLEMPRQAFDFAGSGAAQEESSAVVAARVKRFRDHQIRRQGRLNAALQGSDINRHCALSDDARTLLTTAGEQLAMSARGYHKVIKLARTLADMDNARTLATSHVAEAIGFRTLDRQQRAGRLQSAP